MSNKNKASKKPLEKMNLLDDFLFGAVVVYPEIGEKFVRSILRTIFGREFKHLSVTAQKVFYGSNASLHGARLDVYIEPDKEGSGERASVYDIEPDLKDRPEDKRELPRRVRFYHGKIAARSLNSGADYDSLKNVIVIMITPYDPFGQNRMVYTIKNKCMELPEMEYEDGASTLFLYTKGTEGVPSEAVRQLLHYMESTTYKNAVNQELREIHRMVETVKKDPEVGGMRIQIVEEVIKLSEENAKLTDVNTRQAAENARLTDVNSRQAAEIAKLREELSRKNTLEKLTADDSALQKNQKE